VFGNVLLAAAGAAALLIQPTGLSLLVAHLASIGATTTRFTTVMPRSVKGVKSGGGTEPVAAPDNHRSTPPRYRGSRSRRFSWLTRWLRVSSE
jgi:hypothetical protein